jgi:hypothetical protein
MSTTVELLDFGGEFLRVQVLQWQVSCPHARSSEHWDVEGIWVENDVVLTFVLFRIPLLPSIQMYSARTLPFWSNFMYLANCDR